MRGALPASSARPSVSSSSSRGIDARSGRAGARRSRRKRGSRCHGSFVAFGDDVAGGEAGGIGVVGADPRRVGVERQPLERGAEPGRRRRARAPRRAAASRASLLIRLISVSQSRAAASSASGSVGRADGRPEAALGRLLGRVDRAWIGQRGRLEGCRLVRVVRALGRAQGFRRGVGLAAGAGGQLAAFRGQSPFLGTALDRDRR